MNSDPKKYRHLLYPNVSGCSNFSDDDADEDRRIYKFSPPLNVRIPWIISTPRKWTDWVCWSNCRHKFDELLSHVGDFNLPKFNRKAITDCLTMDVMLHHGYDVMDGNVCNCSKDWCHQNFWYMASY